MANVGSTVSSSARTRCAWTPPRKAAKREAQKQAIAITVAAEAEKDAAQNHALAVTTRAAANLRNYEAEAEGQKRLNEARSTLSSALIDFDLAKERLRTIPQALSETVRPLEKIGEVKIIDLGGGLSGRAGGGNGIASGPAGGPVDGLLGSLLAYRANAPVIDRLLAEADSTEDPTRCRRWSRGRIHRRRTRNYRHPQSPTSCKRRSMRRCANGPRRWPMAMTKGL